MPINQGNDSTGASLNQGITVIFNENMDSATFIQSSCDVVAPFTLIGQKVVAGTISYNGKTAKFTPSGNLLPGTTYTATITTNIRNLSGIPLAKNYSWSFTTADEKNNDVVFNRNIQDNKINK